MNTRCRIRSLVVLVTAALVLLLFGWLEVRESHAQGPDPADLRVIKVSMPGTVVQAGAQFTYTIISDLEISKVDTPDPVAAGSELSYSVRITNTGPSQAENLVIEDNLPAEVEVISVSASSGTCNAGTPGDPFAPTTCTFDTVPQGGSRTMFIVTRVKPDAVTDPVTDQKIIHNDAWVYSNSLDFNEGNNMVTQATTVQASADLALAKFGVGTPRAGALFSYEYDVSNLGPSVSRDVSLRDFLPDEVEFVNAFIDTEGGTGGVPLPCTVTAGTNVLICPLGDIPPTDGVPILAFVNVSIKSDVPDSTTITNFADVNLTDTPDPVPDNNSDSADVTVLTIADVSIQKTSDPAKVCAGEQKRYQISVENNGPSDAQNVTVYDILPDAVRYEVDDNPSTCTQPSNLVGWQAQLSGGNEVPPVDTPASGLASFVLNTDTNELTYSLNVNDIQGITQAHIHTGAAGVNGPVLIWLYDSTGVQAYGGPFSPTSPVVDTITISPADAAAIMANPAGYYVNVHTTAFPGGEIRDQLAQTAETPLKCELGLVKPGDNPQFEVFVEVQPEVPENATITNVAIVDSETTLGDPDMSNNEDKAMNLILMADLEIVKSDDPDPVYAGNPLTYTLTITNSGPTAADNVVVVDNLPDEVRVTRVERDSMAYLMAAGPIERDVVEDIISLSGVSMAGAANCSAGTPGDPNDPTTCVFSRLEPGEVGTMTIVVQVRPDVMPDGASAILIQNDASVDSDVCDANTENNFYTEDTEVLPAAALRIDKTADVTMTLPGGYINYTISLTNTGPTQALDVQVKDMFTHDGDLVTLVASDITGGTGTCQQVDFGIPEIRCNVGDLPAGKVRQIDLKMQVAPPPEAICGYVITNTVKINSIVDPTLSIESTSDITETVIGPACEDVYLPILQKDDGP